jgi:phage-related protein
VVTVAVNSVIYGGVDLATASHALQIVDVNIGGVGRNISTLTPPASDGELFGSAKNGTRTATVTVDIQDDDPNARSEAVRRLNMILESKTPLQLYAPSVLGDKYLNAICTGLPDVSARDWSGDLVIQFTAFDPYFYSDVGNMDVTLTAGATASFYVNCSGPVRPVISQTIASPLTDPTWTDDAGNYIVLQGSVAAGALVIDCEKLDVTLDGVSIMGQLSLDSLFFEFKPNPTTKFTPNTVTCANGAAGRMVGEYRWL